ncbi:MULTISPECIES: hypothetical protein [Anaerotruncus]|uniref:hypothetical protein n=1 Tax=Anaerotruncus TaxID=244127 RepID=UPI001363F11F|nr:MULTISPECIES: hypothetical protein [Anaerotruncus]
MYKITLKQGYDDIEFRFDDMANALVFVETAIMHGIPCTKNNEEQKVEVIVEEMNSEDK